MRPIIVEFELFHVFIVPLRYLPVGITPTSHCSLHYYIIMFTPFREFGGQPKWPGQLIGIVSLVTCSCRWGSVVQEVGTLTSRIDLSCHTEDLWVVRISRGPRATIELGKIILPDQVPLDFSVNIFWYALYFLRYTNKLPSDPPWELSLSLTGCSQVRSFDYSQVINLNALVPHIGLWTW